LRSALPSACIDGAAESFDTSGFTLPPVDLKVVSAKRAHETVQPYTIPDAQRAATPSHIAYCVRQFNADRILVLAAADAARKPFVPPAEVSLQAHDVAGRGEHATRAKAPPSDAQWQTTADEALMARRTGVDAVSCTEASTTHSSLFTLRAAQSINWMPAVSAFTDAIDEAGAQKGLDAFQWEPACRLLLDFQSVEWESGVLEPLALSATVWDLERRERVSETFSVEVNSGEWRQALGEYDRSDAKLAARSCILSLPAMLPSFVVVVSAARPLRGEIDEVLEPMSKGGELKPKDAQKLAAEAKATAGKLAAHWQTLAWTVVPLFDASGRVDARGERAAVPRAHLGLQVQRAGAGGRHSRRQGARVADGVQDARARRVARQNPARRAGPRVAAARADGARVREPTPRRRACGTC
jgi:hypothetical protein